MAGPTFFRARGVFDGVDGTTRRGIGVLIDGARVVDVVAEADTPTGTPVVDLGDVVLVPGFVDAHTHVTIRPGEGDQHGQLARPAVWQTIRGVANLEGMLASGVTTARIMTEHHGIDYEFRAAVERDEVRGPRLLVAGPGLSPPGGHGSGGAGVAGPDALREAVRQRVDAGADHIKIFTTGGVSSVNSSLAQSNYSAEEIEAIVDEAAAAGLKVGSHAHGGPGVDLAVEAGIHSIEHGALLDETNIKNMVEHDTWLVLTNTILFHPSGIEQGDAKVPQIMAKVEEARAYVRQHAAAVRESGMRFALGTDSMHGLFGYELQWLVEHGWTAREALLAATRNGGRLLEDDTVGVLAPGSRADFVALRGDPLTDISAVFDVAAVYRDGRAVAGNAELTV